MKKPPKVTKKIAVSNFRTRVTVVLTWILILALVYLIYFCANMFPVIAGYGAKVLCSCAYIEGRSEDDVVRNEFNQFLGKFLSVSLHPEDSSATGSVLFFVSRKAIYRKGLGCTLAVGVTEDELRGQEFNGRQKPLVDQDTIPWPDGNKIDTDGLSGVNIEAVNRVVDEFFDESSLRSPIKTRGVVVVYDGKLIAEKYALGFDASTPQMGWSMTKGISNALIGILARQGKLSVEAPAPVESWQGDDRKNITITNLLHASSGLAWSEVYFRPSDANEMLFRTEDMGLFVSKKRRATDPDRKFEYSSGSVVLLSWIIRKTVGEQDYHRLPYNRLFNKIGMHSMVLEPDPSGTYVLSSFSYATPRDWARFGLLYLNDGVWNGERILPQGWVQFTSTPAEATHRGEYGAQWRLNVGERETLEHNMFPAIPHDAIYLYGVEGQYLFVVPSSKLVVVRMGLSLRQTPDMNLFVSKIIEVLPEN